MNAIDMLISTLTHALVALPLAGTAVGLATMLLDRRHGRLQPVRFAGSALDRDSVGGTRLHPVATEAVMDIAPELEAANESNSPTAARATRRVA